MALSLLIVEDDLTFSTMLKTWLKKKGFDVETAGTHARARKLLATRNFDLILSDLRLPDKDGMELLSWLRKQKDQVPFIIMTSYAEIQSAVKAIKEGAADYIAKPVQPDELLKKINEAIRHGNSPSTMDETFTPSENFLEGESEAARQLYSYVSLVAPTQMSVLINGASGTGKEYVAHRIHQLSKRARKPFIAIDCGSIPKDLAASEFFGHVKGSFTGAFNDKTGAFEEANGGTLFLDEVGNLGYEVQIQLLRALQERRIRPIGSNREIEVDVRLISATNENLKEAIAKGNFREDLFYRLNVVHIEVPPLRERKEDIDLLAASFLETFNSEDKRKIEGFTPAAKKALLSYSWPGNIRELKNAIESAVVLARGKNIDKDDLPQQVRDSGSGARISFDLPITLDEAERRLILETISYAKGNKTKAAELLGIGRKTISRRMQDLKIEEDENGH